MLTIIGDVHGYHDSYLNIATKCEATVQVGDFGFNYEVLNGMDPDLHKIVGGNHDNYAIIKDCPYYLGDYGLANVGGVEFFFVRGENSVDKNIRIEGKNWWREEELDMNTAYKAIEAYISAKPQIVISHGCPADVMPFFITNPSKQFSPSRTSQMLDAMWNSHRPKLWVFGHHHNSHSITVGDSVFRCLNELETMNIS
jgi:predicted phosphodiesterase